MRLKYFSIIKPTRCTNFANLLRHETLHVLGSSSVPHQEFIDCTLGTCICYTGLKTAFEQEQDGSNAWNGIPHVTSYETNRSIPTNNKIKPVPSWSCLKAVFKPVWHIPVPSVQWINSWWWTEELPEPCRVSCQNKFVKLLHLVGFIIKKFVTMHGHINVKD